MNYCIRLATSGSDAGKTDRQRKREQLHLALEWNRVDIAKNYIMKNDQDWEVRRRQRALYSWMAAPRVFLFHQNIELHDLFTLALDRNQTAFVKLFLDHDFSLTDLFRNNEKLLNLYMNDIKNASADARRRISSAILHFTSLSRFMISPMILYERSTEKSFNRRSETSSMSTLYCSHNARRPCTN